MPNEYDGPPQASAWLLSEHKRCNRLSWRIALGELLDNSFDAGATKVVVSIEADGGDTVVVVSDNGSGCDNLKDFAVIGSRTDHRTTKSGRFGVGAKDVWNWAFPVITIVSATTNKLSKSNIDLGKLYRTNTWRYEVPSESLNPTVSNVKRHGIIGDTGTTIHLSIRDRDIDGIIKRTIPVGKVSKLADDIAELFTPGLMQGLKIRIHDKRPKGIKRNLSCPRLPDMEYVVDETLQVGPHEIRLFAGAVLSGKTNTSPGISVHHCFRVFNEPVSLPECTESQISGFITLPVDFPVSTNKGDFAEYKDEVQDAVSDAMSDIAEHTQARLRQVETTAFTSVLNSLWASGPLGAPGRKKRERRKITRDGNNGTVEPQNTGVKRQRAADSTNDNGSVLSSRAHPSGLQFSFGKIDGNEPVRVSETEVTLNTNVEFFRMLEERGDEDSALISYFIASLMALSKDMTRPADKAQLRMRFGEDAPGEDWRFACYMLLKILDPAARLMELEVTHAS